MAQSNPFSLSDIHHRGLMIVLASPSGAGKTTIARRLVENDDDLTFSVSITTRAPRPGEVDGDDYHFVNVAEFQRLIDEGAFLEHAHVFGHQYGTPLAQIEKTLETGKDIIFDVDWQGTHQIAAKARADLVSVFILPPSWEELERRLLKRSKSDLDEVGRRMSKALDEISHWTEYDYVLINHDLDHTVDLVRKILDAERAKRSRQMGLDDFVKNIKTGH